MIDLNEPLASEPLASNAPPVDDLADVDLDTTHRKDIIHRPNKRGVQPVRQLPVKDPPVGNSLQTVMPFAALVLHNPGGRRLNV